jgi:pimeloyl-ACP methyl ester carboxylesterase
MADREHPPRPRRIPGLLATERVHSVPLDHADPGGERIEVFTREVADPDGADRPLLLFLEGGPGFEAPRPTRVGRAPPWLERALSDFRVLLMDQRGTGRSTPVGPIAGGDPVEQAGRLANFRADSIVADAELIRAELGGEQWSVLGQSFGGFCALRYLSAAPEGLREVMFTGGLPPLGETIDEVYAATFERMRERSRRYYERYPEDRARVLALLERLARDPIELPDGDVLHGRRLLSLGEMLGAAAGAESLHYILELDPDSAAFRHDVQAAFPFARNPLYALVHEACWADGGRTRWSAQRMLGAIDGWGPELFTGEHVFPWMFEDISELAPLRETAELLAEREWPALYDPARLAANEVPAAAVVYAEDAYVERRFSEQTAARVGGLRMWLTNEFEHDGLRQDGERVLGRLLDLVRGRR